MPINIYSQNTSEKLAYLCDSNWRLPDQVEALENWLKDRANKIKRGKYVADIGFTLREVNAASVKVAQRKKNSRFTVAVTRLHDIETKKRVPSIHCLYTLSVVYRCPLHDILLLYGIY